MSQNFAAFDQGPVGLISTLNITSETVVYAKPGLLVSIVVTTAGSAVGSIHDAATTGASAAGNLVAVIPETVGPIQFGGGGFPLENGLLVIPGTGQVVNVAYRTTGG